MEIRFVNVNFVIDTYTPLEKTILKDISFEITEKGIYSFIGKSNSGKTAIGDLINALVIPNTGRVVIDKYINDGRRIKHINKLRRETGYVFKNPYDMFFNNTVKKELSFGMKYFKYKKKHIKERISNALKLVELDERILNVDPFRLDLIDAKKVALACILTYNPNIIILDEFTNGLGNKEKNELIRLLKMLKNKYNKTIILLTKDTNFAYQVTDHVFLLDKARIITEGNKELLRDSELLNSLGLEVPFIVKFINEYKKHNKYFYDYTNILDLIKGVYRDVF
jgi:energy-coupling factor transport system ATP-binding protein